MVTFVLTFALLLLIMLGMSLGVILMNKRIKGSCAGSTRSLMPTIALSATRKSTRTAPCAKGSIARAPAKCLSRWKRIA